MPLLAPRLSIVRHVGRCPPPDSSALCIVVLKVRAPPWCHETRAMYTGVWRCADVQQACTHGVAQRRSPATVSGTTLV
jgi:hypothetical protein